MPEDVAIRIPPSTGYIALVRATATGLGARLDLTYDQIMDLHIAIDEVCSRLLASTREPRALRVAFAVEDDALTFSATAEGPREPAREVLNPWSRKILEALVERFELRDGDHDATVHVRVARR